MIKVSLVCVNDVTFGKHRRVGDEYQWSQPVIRSWWGAGEGKRGWKLNQLPLANDLVSHVYVVKASIKTPKRTVWGPFFGVSA